MGEDTPTACLWTVTDCSRGGNVEGTLLNFAMHHFRQATEGYGNANVLNLMMLYFLLEDGNVSSIDGWSSDEEEKDEISGIASALTKKNCRILRVIF
ncbi:Protein of unknown function [Gryllus bimaculatus]|nr:Protein of unknown function [Gryllus bimaculatus]